MSNQIHSLLSPLADSEDTVSPYRKVLSAIYAKLVRKADGTRFIAIIGLERICLLLAVRLHFEGYTGCGVWLGAANA